MSKCLPETIQGSWNRALKVLVFLTGFAFTGYAAAADNAWKSIGPYTTYVVDAVVADPANAQTVYFSSLNYGLWKSTDGGASLAYIGNGLSLGGYIRDVAIDPTDPRILYVGLFGGVCKTTDGGNSWQQVSQGMSVDTYVLFLGMDPSNPRTLYAHSTKGLFKSLDAGGSWTMIHPIPANSSNRTVGIDPRDPRNLYLTTLRTEQGETGIFRSTDAGTTWTKVQPDVRGYSLTIDPSNPRDIYVTTLSDSLYVSRDGGVSWGITRVAIEGSPEHLRSLVVDPSRSRTLYALPSLNASSGILKSVDGGASWTRLTAGLPSSRIDKLAISGSNPQVWYAGASFDGVYRSADDGKTWNRLRWAAYPAATLARGSAGRLYTFLSPFMPNWGLYMTADDGATWTGLVNGGGLVVTHPSSPQIMYCGTGAPVMMRKSTDGWATYKDVNSGLPTQPGARVCALALDPSNILTVYAGIALSSATAMASAGPGEVGVYRTTDGGNSWQWMNTGLPTNRRVRVLAVDPARPNTVYAGFDSLGVYKTTDGGASWVGINAGLPDKVSVLALAPDPLQRQTVLAGTPEGIYKTIDGGVSWRSVSSGLPASIAVRAFALDPSREQTVYAATSSGVYLSVDGGASWTSFGSGLASRSILILELDPVTRKLYAGVDYGGVWTVGIAGVGGRLLADFDGNGAVDLDDFFLFAEAFGKEATGAVARMDLDGDGKIDFDDFFLLIAYFGK